MKHIFIIMIAAVVLLFSRGLYAETVERIFTLDESLKTGLNNSQELLELQEQIGFSRERVNEAGSLIYPKIDFNMFASQFNNDFSTVLAPSFNSIYLPGAKKDIYYSTRFSLWQYLYAGGKYTTNLRLAEINLSQAKSQADVVKNRVTRDVTKAFYSCIALKEKMKAYEAAIKDSLRLAVASAQKEKWESLAARYDGELERLKFIYERQKLSFLSAAGIELDTSVDFSGELAAALEDYELNKCLAWAFQYRPELSQTQYQETIDSLRVNLSLTERYPTVALGAGYEWAGDQMPMKNTNWNATININVPIFDGWASWARIRQRRYQAREGKIRRSKMEDQIRLEVRQAFMDYNYWKSRANDINSRDKNENLQPDEKLNNAAGRIEIIEQALNSKAVIDWSIGRVFFK